MSESGTGTWFNVDWVLRQLEYAEQWAKDKYISDLETATVKLIGKTVLVDGWKGLLLRRTRLTTREDAEKAVRDDSSSWWYPIEYDLRTTRNAFVKKVVDLRQAATTAQRAEVSLLFVSKADMVYLS